MSYSDSYFTTRETWRDWRIEAHELMRLARVTRDARVLEIGCGGGGLLRLLHERGACAVGVDTLSAALNLACERLKTDKVTRGEGDKKKKLALSPCHLVTLSRIGEDNWLPFRNNAFDVVIGQHVIEHLPDVDAALREWKRVLKPRGHVALATPNARYPDPTHFADADHAHIFSPDELRGMVARAGFIVEQCFTIFPFLLRERALRALGVIAYRVFQHEPYYALRGRTIILAARKG
jgi:2-polyprenyl-3-methyl-5-hydroxy-6-metoxy-1,4-benzoquinol methylase